MPTLDPVLFYKDIEANIPEQKDSNAFYATVNRDDNNIVEQVHLGNYKLSATEDIIYYQIPLYSNTTATTYSGTYVISKHNIPKIGDTAVMYTNTGSISGTGTVNAVSLYNSSTRIYKIQYLIRISSSTSYAYTGYMKPVLIGGGLYTNITPTVSVDFSTISEIKETTTVNAISRIWKPTTRVFMTNNLFNMCLNNTNSYISGNMEAIHLSSIVDKAINYQQEIFIVATFSNDIFLTFQLSECTSTTYTFKHISTSLENSPVLLSLTITTDGKIRLSKTNLTAGSIPIASETVLGGVQVQRKTGLYTDSVGNLINGLHFKTNCKLIDTNPYTIQYNDYEFQRTYTILEYGINDANLMIDIDWNYEPGGFVGIQNEQYILICNRSGRAIKIVFNSSCPVMQSDILSLDDSQCMEFSLYYIHVDDPNGTHISNDFIVVTNGRSYNIVN